MSNMTPTVIIANSALLREGMVSLLKSTSYKVVAAVSRPAELIDHDSTNGRRGLAIVGIDCQKKVLGQAAEGIRLLRSAMLDSKIVLIAEDNGPVDLQGVLALAADGYIFNLGSRDTLVRSLELIFMDQRVFVLSSSPITTIPNESSDTQPPERTVLSQFWGSCGIGKGNAQLSHRERQVMICLAHGDSNKEIARVCHISEATVKVHLKAILRKINARNRTQAAIWTIEHGLSASLNDNAELPERHHETTTDAPSLSHTEPPAGVRLSRPINDHAHS